MLYSAQKICSKGQPNEVSRTQKSWLGGCCAKLDQIYFYQLNKNFNAKMSQDRKVWGHHEVGKLE